jgi:hypothetical protein
MGNCKWITVNSIGYNYSYGKIMGSWVRAL